MSTDRLLLPVLAAGLVSSLCASPQSAPADALEPERELQVRQALGSSSLESMLTRPLVRPGGSQDLWVRTRGQRVHLAPEGASIYPAFGPDAVREWPVHLRLAQATRGSYGFGLEAPALLSREAERVSLRRAELDEVYHLGLDGIEQTFVFEHLPGAGDLLVEVDVETDLVPESDGKRLRFLHPSLGYVDYGEAFAFDAEGARISIDRRWTGSSIELRVPADFLARAVLPLTIDPVISTFVNNYGAADDRSPDIAYAGASQRYLLTWEDFTSQANSDVYVTAWDNELQNPLGTDAIDISNDDWTEPVIAYCTAYDRAVIAAIVDPGSSFSRIEARLFDVGASSVVGNLITVDPGGALRESDLDIGGSNASLQSASNFCVTWTKRYPGDNHDVEYRVFRADGVPVTNKLSMGAGLDNDMQSTISPGVGDSSEPGDYWYVVWIQDNDRDGRGTIFARRVYFTGSLAQSGPVFQVSTPDRFSNPVVSSLMSAPVTLTDLRPALVVSEIHEPDLQQASGYQTDISVISLFGDDSVASSNITKMEDFDRELLQRRPVIATAGRAFLIAYQEEDYESPGTDQWDIYLATGEVTRRTHTSYEALAERHIRVADSLDAEVDPQIATRWQGAVGSDEIEGALIYTHEVGTSPQGFGRIEGARLTYPVAAPSTVRAIGRQYCDANPNSTGTFGGRGSSWMRIFGDQSIGSPHLMQALDLPPGQFCMLLTSRNSGFLQNPGGSAGNLCLGPNIGRFKGQIGVSDGNGTVNVIVDPTALPQQSGVISAQHFENWKFQFWHRDLEGGQPISNFTNACLVTFLN